MRKAVFESLRRSIADQDLVALATVVAGPEIGSQLLIWPGGQTLGDLGSPRLNQRAALYAEQLFPTQQSARKTFDRQDATVDVFFDVLAPPPRLVIVGAVHVAAHLVRFARELGFQTILVDPRSAFLDQERFAQADRRIGSWPEDAIREVGIDESTFVAVLSHDPKIDLPAIEAALRSPARYIGVLGSRKSHRKRRSALREKGFSEPDLERLQAPIGLDLGGRRAEEIALAIAAEMVAVHHGRTGAPMNAG
jgi:xanthine dehydrogenase accessory factor